MGVAAVERIGVRVMICRRATMQTRSSSSKLQQFDRPGERTCLGCGSTRLASNSFLNGSSQPNGADLPGRVWRTRRPLEHARARVLPISNCVVTGKEFRLLTSAATCVLPVLLLLLLSIVHSAFADTTNTQDEATVIIAVGAAGEKEYGKDFAQWAQLWEKACQQGGAKSIVIGQGPTNETSDLSRLQQVLAAEPTNSAAELWLVFLGHGTFDGREAKFNLRGPDVSASELADWLKPFHRPVAVVNCASSSSPFLNKLSAPGRVIVTATRSGYEQNFARFGQYLAAAIADPEADLDKDGQTSLLEAFVMASRQVGEYYDAQGRLATEHALLDDNGDGLGTPADWFRGVRAVKKAADGASVDGLRANQFCLVRSEFERKLSPETRARRDELELAVARLRESKATLDEDEYYRRLEKLLIPLAQLYAEESKPQ